MARWGSSGADRRRGHTSRFLVIIAVVAVAFFPDVAGAKLLLPPNGGAPLPQPGVAATDCKPTLSYKGDKAVAPACAPIPVKRAVRAANRIRKKPYVWGGGHGFGSAGGFDCSGAVSYVLRGAKLLKVPRTSGALTVWRSPGRGRWLTVNANAGHAFIIIGGKRFDTSGPGASGPRWRKSQRTFSKAFVKRHAKGL